MGARSAVATHPAMNPSSFAHQTQGLAAYFAELAVHEKNKIIRGSVHTPTTASSQITGAGATDWNVNMSELEAVVNGVYYWLASAADYNIHTGSLYTGLVSGNSAVAAVVLQNNAGTVSLAVVKGAAAVTGLQVPPTDAEIQTALGAGVAWVKVAECTLNRTADTTVTQSQNVQVRPILGVNVGGSFGTFDA